MLKFLHLFGHYYLGLSFVGLAAFVIQEIPYMVMPLIKLRSNPIMNMQGGNRFLETAQGILGVLSMILLMLIVMDDIAVFPLATSREILFFALTVLMIMINFAGWAFYYTGHQYGLLIVLTQFAAVPLYYLFFGLWQQNYLLAASSVPFFIIHTVNGYINFVVVKQ